MNNVSTERMQTMLDLIGSSFAHNAMNKLDVTAREGPASRLAGARVKGDCGDGVRDFGTTDANGYLEVRVPHVTCDFTITTATGGSKIEDFAVFGDKALSATLVNGNVGGTVGATLSLTLGTPGLVRRVHAGHHEDLRGGHHRHRDLDRGRRAPERRRPELDHTPATW